MKKILMLSYFLIGSSLTFFALSILGCNSEHYSFVYKLSNTAFYKLQNDGNQSIVTDSCRYDSLLVGAHLDREVLTASNKTFGAGNNLYAYQPADPVYTLAEKITDIKIITVDDYNANYPAGSDMSGIAAFSRNGFYDPNGNTSKENIIADLNDTKAYKFTDIYLVVQARFNQAPANKGIHRFVFEIKTEINDIMRDTTDAITILP